MCPRAQVRGRPHSAGKSLFFAPFLSFFFLFYIATLPFLGSVSLSLGSLSLGSLSLSVGLSASQQPAVPLAAGFLLNSVLVLACLCYGCFLFVRLILLT